MWRSGYALVDPVQGKIAQLPRITRFVATAAIVTALYFIPTVTFTQFAISCFVAATYWRTMLVPREVCSWISLHLSSHQHSRTF